MELSRRELNKQNSRKRILKASRKLFSTKGYEETMIEDIAHRAEVSKATLYNYFPNKESLLIGTAQEVIDRARSLAQNGAKTYANSEQKLRRILAEFIQASVDYLGLSRRITYLNACEDSALFDTSRAMIDLFRDLVVNAQAEGIFRQDADPDEIVDLAMGIYLMAQFQWLRIGEYTPEYLKEKLDRFFTAAMASYYVRQP